jgi:parallel beta-helix repeat protein
VDYDATDADSDTPTFSCNRTDMFTDFSAATGTGNWTTTYTDSGTYYVDFGVSDGWGSTSNYTMTITVTSAESIPPDPVNLANTTDNLHVNHTWDAGRDGWHLIAGAIDGVFGGYNWSSAWQNDDGIVDGLTGVEHSSAPVAFERDRTWYLISGEYKGVFNGYTWTGTTWQNDSGVVTGLGDVGRYSTPAVFEKGGIWYLIAGEEDGVFNGYNWTGSAWQSDSGIVGGLGDVGSHSTPTVFEKGETWYLIAGNDTGVFNGYNWTGSAWQSDSGIVSGLGDVGYNSAPTTFEKGETWYLISGDDIGLFNGYNWTGSAWQSDSGIVSGLGDVGFNSVPTVVDMNNVTDSYNISVNDVWHNGTTDTFYTDTYAPGAWQNITVYAYNASGTGTLSSGSISQNTQVAVDTTTYSPSDPKNIQSTTGNFWVRHAWEAGIGNVTDSYNVRVNSVWHNGTADVFYNDTYTAHAWQNITVYAYNASGIGTLSTGSISQDTQIPNNPVTITNTSDWSGDPGENIYVDYDTTDADSDTPTFSCSRTDLFTDFSTATGQGNWTPLVNGTYEIDFGVSDGWGSTSNYTMTIEVGIPTPITITLLSQDPSDLHQNSTGTFNQTWGIKHTDPLNNSTITYIYHNIHNSDAHHSLRMPVNNRAPTGWRGDNRNESGAERMTMEGNTTVFGSDIWTWGGKDLNSTRMTLEVINSTYAKIHINCTVQCLTTSNSWYLNRKELQNAAKTQIDIDKGHTWLVKFFDPEVAAGRDTNYTASFWIDTMATASAPPAPGDTLYIYYANGSFDPTGGVNIKDSPYSGLLGSVNYTQWLDHKYTANQSNYIRFDVYAGRFPEIALDAEMYVYFEFDSPKKMKINVTDAATSTNITFGETGVLWTGTPTGSTYTASPHTPNIFMTFHRGNQTFESRMWAMDTGGNLLSSNLEQTPITQSDFPPTTPTFRQFTFAGHNDTSMDCTYRDNITIWLDPGSDPDGGSTTTNLTLWTADRTTCVAIINATIPGGSGMLPIVLNTTPHYSDTTLYTLRGVVIDDEFATSTRWLPMNFALSPLGTSGAFVDGSRVTFWGIDDLPALYTAISDPTAISLSGSTYTFHKVIHHSQYGDLWNVSSDIRIVSTNDPGTPYYRLTGTDDIDGATITSWNETTGAPAQSTEEYRAYLYSDAHYSRIDIMNSNISYFGKGIAPYRGIFIQNGEGAVIDNNTFIHNGYGISVLNGGNFTVSNNTVIDPVGQSISISDTNGNVTVRDNIVHSDVETSGITMIRGGSSNEFINNSITGEAQSGFYNQYISDSTFRDNTLDNVQNGIVLSKNCSNITILANDITVAMDVHGNPAWGVTIMSGTHNVSDNVIHATGGYGIVMSNFYPAIGCVDSVITNNSITTTSGTHPDAGVFADYVLNWNSTGNIIRDPADTTNSISITTGSDANIENTHNTVFSEDSTNHTTYAYPSNFSLFADTGELFNITQYTMTATPETDRLRLWNLGWTGDVTFNASTDTTGNQVWFNITKATWADLNIAVYRNGTEYYNSTADASGFFAYNYSGGWSERYFAFVCGNLAPDKPTLVAPANGATGTSTNPTLRVTVTDPDADTMNITFYQQGGTQIGSTQTGIANGGTASVVWSGRSYSTTYYWYAVAHDGAAGTQSNTWHFRTQATGGGGGGGGVSHDIAITGCNDWNGNAGTTATIDFSYINEDADSPVFTTNATKGTLNAATGVWTWATGAGDVGVYNWWFRVQNAYGNSDDCTVTVTVYTADTPLGLGSTTGNFWVDHTWNAVAGASEYRVNVNGAWHNGTATHYPNTLMSPHGWSNITLASYNASTGVSSFISDEVQIPNNPITITNYSDQNVFVGDNVTVDLDYADLDGDTPTFSCSRTDLFTDFNTATGTGNWTTTTNGTFEIDFGVTDGWGSVSNCTMTVRVGERAKLPTTIPISIWITLTVLLFGFVVYTLHVRGYVQKIFAGMISVTMAYIQSQQIVSGNVVQITSLMSSTDVIITEKVEVVIPELAYLLLFVAAIMSLVTSVFIVKYIQFLYKKANAIKSKEEEL